MEKIFKFLGCTDSQKVNYATYMFEGGERDDGVLVLVTKNQNLLLTTFPNIKAYTSITT